MVATIEKLGPAETIINTLLTYSDHMVHNRPGVVRKDDTSPSGVLWKPASYRLENGVSVVYLRDKLIRGGPAKIGVLDLETKRVMNGPTHVGDYRLPGIFPEVATYLYRQVAEVWKLDNEFAARWASYAFRQSHRDMKVVLAGFMLCQSRKGDAVEENGQVVFYDEDYRDVGDAMLLAFSPKLIQRVRQLLLVPGVIDINRQLGFGKSMRNPFLGRWTKTVQKWLRHRESNPKLLKDLVKAGFRTTVMRLAREVGYKPESPEFFETLRWKQVQCEDGRRTISIGKDIAPAESWEALDEKAICDRIAKDKPDFKRVVGMLPKSIGLTRAIMAVSIESGCLSKKDLIIYSPTIEDLGLMDVQEIRERWSAAVKESEDQRAANIAARMACAKAKEALLEGADNAIKKQVEEVSKNIRIYFMVDVSGSMAESIEKAKVYIEMFLHSFPLDRLHVSVFNTSGKEITIKHPSSAGVAQAFRGISAGGGTAYGAGIAAISHHRPNPDEDVLFFFVGDEDAMPFEGVVVASELHPVAFGFLKVGGNDMCIAVRSTAASLNIPCFMVNPETFSDPYAVQRTIRNLIASTPVHQQPWLRSDYYRRQSLIDVIQKTELLRKPAWA